MTRFVFTFAFLLFVVPAMVGCGPGENKVITGNDQAQAEAEEAEAEADEQPGEEPGGAARGAAAAANDEP